MNTPKSLTERLGVWGVGFTANTLMVWPFDFLLYPYVIATFGWIGGGVVMTLASFIYCLLTFKFYDWAKKDWIGIETLKEVQEIKGQSFFSKIIGKLNKHSWLAFIVFSLQTDPFITTVFMREGAHQYRRLSKRDWKIFLGSLLLGNVFWTLVCGLGLETAKAFGLTIGQVLTIVFVTMVAVYIGGVLSRNKSRSL